MVVFCEEPRHCSSQRAMLGLPLVQFFLYVDHVPCKVQFFHLRIVKYENEILEKNTRLLLVWSSVIMMYRKASSWVFTSSRNMSITFSVLQVLLPEGSKNPQAIVPFPTKVIPSFLHLPPSQFLDFGLLYRWQLARVHSFKELRSIDTKKKTQLNDDQFIF